VDYSLTKIRVAVQYVIVVKSGWLTKCKTHQWEIKHCLKQTNVTTVQMLGQCIHWSSIGLSSSLQGF